MDIGFGTECTLLDKNSGTSICICAYLSHDERRLVVTKKDLPITMEDVTEVHCTNKKGDNKKYWISDYEEKLLSVETFIIHLVPYK